MDASIWNEILNKTMASKYSYNKFENIYKLNIRCLQRVENIVPTK